MHLDIKSSDIHLSSASCIAKSFCLQLFFQAAFFISQQEDQQRSLDEQANELGVIRTVREDLEAKLAAAEEALQGASQEQETSISRIEVCMQKFDSTAI